MRVGWLEKALKNLEDEANYATRRHETPLPSISKGCDGREQKEQKETDLFHCEKGNRENKSPLLARVFNPSLGKNARRERSW